MIPAVKGKDQTELFDKCCISKNGTVPKRGLSHFCGVNQRSFIGRKFVGIAPDGSGVSPEWRWVKRVFRGHGRCYVSLKYGSVFAEYGSTNQMVAGLRPRSAPSFLCASKETKQRNTPELLARHSLRRRQVPFIPQLF